MLNNTQSEFLNFARWTAAALVVVEHVRNLLFVDYGSLETTGLASKVFYFLTGFGHEAVVIFFVISGFLVGGKTLEKWRQGTFIYRKYLCDRISRLYAVLIVALILGAVVDMSGASFFESTGLYDGTTKESIVVLPENILERVSFVGFVGNLAMLQSIKVQTFGSNGPLWSLAHEWWYYLLFPLVLTALRASTGMRIFSAVFLVSIYFLITKYILILFGVWLIGVLARVLNYRQLVPWVVSLALFIGSLILMRLDILTIPYLNQFMVGAGFALMLNSVSKYDSVWPGTLLSKSLADFSYSVYLVHFPVILFSTAAFMSYQESYERLDLSAISILIFLFITLVAFITSYLVSIVTEQKTSQVRDWLYRLARV